MGALPVEVQGRRLVQAHPSFRPILLTDWLGVWEGTLCPVMQPYRVRIRYVRYDPLTCGVLDHPPLEVFVLDPAIGPDPRGTGEPPPHVYKYGYPPDRPALCLYDPARREWSPSDLIADTIIPWAIEWLLWFELWVWDGIWRGGGRHPGEPVSGPGATLDRGYGEDGHPDRFNLGNSTQSGRRMNGGASWLAIASWLARTSTNPPSVPKPLLQGITERDGAGRTRLRGSRVPMTRTSSSAWAAA